MEIKKEQKCNDKKSHSDAAVKTHAKELYYKIQKCEAKTSWNAIKKSLKGTNNWNNKKMYAIEIKLKLAIYYDVLMHH